MSGLGNYIGKKRVSSTEMEVRMKNSGYTKAGKIKVTREIIKDGVE